MLFRELTICVVPPCLMCSESWCVIWWNWTRTGFFFIHWTKSGVFQWQMKWDAWGDDSVSNSLFTVHLPFAVTALAIRKGVCLCLSASSWHAASRKRREESSWYSSCSVWACNSQTSKETHMFFNFFQTLCVCPCSKFFFRRGKK